MSAVIDSTDMFPFVRIWMDSPGNDVEVPFQYIRGVNPFGAIFVVLIVAVSGACALVAILVGRRPRSPAYVVQAAAIGFLAGLAPISVVVFLRLSYKACAVLNILGLPWAEPWRDLAHWGGAAVWVASTCFLVFALVKPGLRRAGIAMSIWSGVIAIPTMLLLFLVVYGDPAASCIPV